MGYSPVRTGWGYPPRMDCTWTGYAAGGTPLDFPREDFLVSDTFKFLTKTHNKFRPVSSISSIHETNKKTTTMSSLCCNNLY